MLLVFTLIATSYSSLHNNSKQNALYKSIIIGILTVSLVLLTGMMSLSILCLFVFVLFLNSKISIIYKGVLLFIVPMIIYFSFNYIKNFDTINHVRGSEHVVYRVQKILNSKDTVRISNWKSVSKVIAANPLLGVGVDGGLEKLQQERNVLSEPYINKHNAHNDYLEILLRYGIIGLVLYLGILYKLFVRYFQNRNTVFLWFILVFMISGLTESYLQRQIGLTFFTFYSLLFYTFKDSK
jgi:O-antigen ligase